jgi:uncharacterized membrane protein YdjX (TVP38/TMEM64 family)
MADVTLAPRTGDPDAPGRWVRLGVLVVLVVGLVFAAHASGLTAHLRTGELRSRMAAAGAWGPVGYVAAFSAGELAHVPGWVFITAAVVSYGLLRGATLAFVGAMVSLSVSFAVVRGVGGKQLAAIRWQFVRRMLAHLDERPIRTVALLRLVFSMSPQLNYGLALSSVRWRDYLIGSALGLGPPIFGIAFIADRYAYLLDEITFSAAFGLLHSPAVLLGIIVGVGYTIEASIGFGSTLVILALGSLLMPVDWVLYRILPLNLLLSTSILVRRPSAVDTRVLFRLILPAMACGMPIGLYVLAKVPPSELQLGFAVFVFVLAAAELVSMARAGNGAARPLSLAKSRAMLFFAGIVHGALATAGPPVVYVCARRLPDKATFRTTLSALWLTLGAVLVVTHTLQGHITTTTLRDSVWFLPGLACGMGVGEVLHGRVPERAFRVAVFIALLVVAVVLGVRA